MALAALAPMLLLAGFAISRARSHEDADVSEGPHPEEA